MDTYEATNVLLSKIKNIDPANASKIMGYILIQDLTDNDLLSLALGSETLLQNVIIKAKTHLGLFTNALSTYSERSSPSLFNPVSKPKNNHDTSSQSSAKANPFLGFAKNPFPHSWPASGLTNNSTAASIGPKSSPFLSYDNIRAGSAVMPQFSNNCVNGSGGDASSNSTDLLNEYQIDEYFPFLDELSPKNDESVDPRIQLGGFNVNNVESHFHRRRFSESDACIGIEDVSFGIGNRPCMYFARGFCKNGDNCKFIHGGFDGDNISEVSGSGVIGGSVPDPSVLFESRTQVTGDLSSLAFADRTAAMAEKRVIETWVTVESVTDTCMEVADGLGCTDMEKMNNLNRDTCPGFISDGRSRVEWVNEAYRKMVMVRPENTDGPYSSVEEIITVRLVMKEKILPYLYYPTFTCWVRLQYTWPKEKFSQMVPCDVWKMESGGFAWRLDVKAALSLGL